MQAKLRDDEIIRWARFVKSHPNEWKAIRSKFINAQFTKHEEFLKRLSSSPGSKEKIDRLFYKTK